MNEQMELLKSEAKYKIRFIFDGGTRGRNPNYGYGSFKIDGETPIRVEFDEIMGNNTAETKTLCEALLYLLEHEEDTENISLEIVTDNKLVQQMVMANNLKGKVIPLFNAVMEAKRLLRKFHSFKIKWFPREVCVQHLGH